MNKKKKIDYHEVQNNSTAEINIAFSKIKDFHHVIPSTNEMNYFQSVIYFISD